MTAHDREPAPHEPRRSFLARFFGGLDAAGQSGRLSLVLAGACVVIFLAGFTYESHSTLAIEDVPGFFAAFGFVAFSCVILLARLLRVLVKRPEDYYGQQAVDAESYPASGLERRRQDAD